MILTLDKYNCRSSSDKKLISVWRVRKHLVGRQLKGLFPESERTCITQHADAYVNLWWRFYDVSKDCVQITSGQRFPLSLLMFVKTVTNFCWYAVYFNWWWICSLKNNDIHIDVYMTINLYIKNKFFAPCLTLPLLRICANHPITMVLLGMSAIRKW